MYDVLIWYFKVDY